jgi:hypothetical protein
LFFTTHNRAQAKFNHAQKVLHPSLCVHYMRKAGWIDEWIENVIDIAVDVWTKHYKPTSGSPDEEEALRTQFGYSVWKALRSVTC